MRMCFYCFQWVIIRWIQESMVLMHDGWLSCLSGAFLVCNNYSQWLQYLVASIECGSPPSYYFSDRANQISGNKFPSWLKSSRQLLHWFQWPFGVMMKKQNSSVTEGLEGRGVSDIQSGSYRRLYLKFTLAACSVWVNSPICFTLAPDGW